MVINVPIYIHGMTIDPDPAAEPDGRMRDFHSAVLVAEPQLAGRLSLPIYTCWGHVPLPAFGGLGLGDDRFLSAAEFQLDGATRDRSVGFSFAWPLKRLAAWMTGRFIREPVVLYGLGDVAYYCSSEGEAEVRKTVYGQVLQGLNQYLGAPLEVRLHVVAHSLGVTVAHDLLYGLFNAASGYFPAVPQALTPAITAWRARAAAGTLTLGSFSAFASQLPVTVLRKQPLVLLFAGGGHLDPNNIGIRPGAAPCWSLFYDTKDALAFRSRALYQPNSAISETRVDNGLHPVDVHLGYWTNERVVASTAGLIRGRS